MSRLTRYGLAVTAMVLLAGGCGERAPRSFVQPNVLKKSDLQGTWYYIQTVTDSPVTSTVAFIGLSSELMKVKFDVQEGFLYARRAYEQIYNSEDAHTADPAKYVGQILAAWRISAQFDIIRDYNPTTGEETNRIIESTERPWNEREFLRVDWSQNQATDYVGIGLSFFFDDVKIDPVSYWESDPTKPDAFHMERVPAANAGPGMEADPDELAEFSPGEANYFDVTNMLALQPTEKTICYEMNGTQECFSAPACLFRHQLDDCATQILKVRHAFSKISPKHDYQPRKWDGKQMDLFGIWDVGLNRLSYNRQYGVTNSGITRHAARFNLWKKSYQDDKKTLIPYANREQRTIPYYAESSLEPFPAALFDSGKEVVRQWNEAVTVAVKDVTGKPATQDVFVWCHNPVKLQDDSLGMKDPAACKSNLKPQIGADGKPILDKNGDMIFKARQGDPRRSTIYWVNEFQAAGPLGYGPPLFDLETGETLSGQSYIFGGALDSYAARSRDLILLITGRLDAEQYTSGQNVKDWVAANRAGSANKPDLHDRADVIARTDAMNFDWAKGLAPHAPIDRSSPKAFLDSLKSRQKEIFDTGVFGDAQAADIAQVRRNRLFGGILESMMITPDVLSMSQLGPNVSWDSLSEGEKARVSPLRSQAIIKEIQSRKDRLSKFGVDFADFADEGLAQRAINYSRDPNIPNMDPEAIREKVRQEIFLAVTLHEMGHNVGLRHNFRASFDAMNYHPGYWQARMAGLTATQRYAGLDSSTGQATGVPFAGADCNMPGKKGSLRPRYVDCPGGATSVEEANDGAFEYQYASIMDYGSEFNSDLYGLGHYDKAAMKFSYAGDGYVEVFKNAKSDAASQAKWEAIHVFQGAFGFPSPLTLTADLKSINYTEYPSLFENGIADIEEREDVPFAEITAGGGGSLLSDNQARVMVPYFFCSDEFVGNLTCQRFDSGADAYEQGKDLISRYNNYYLMNNFKRDRYTFYTSASYKSRIASRYFDILREQLTWYALLRASFTDFLVQTGNPNPAAGVETFFTDENGWGNFSVAVTSGFDLIGRTLTTPEAGTYTFVPANVAPDYPFPYHKQSNDSVGASGTGKVVGLIDGKYNDTTWDFDECGYYWADECQTRVGYFIDKTVALDVLSQSQAYFTGRDTSTDVRKYAIGYYTLFKRQIQEKLGALLAGDYQSVAPYFDANNKVVNNPWTLNSDGTTKPANSLIDPSTGFSLQLYSGVYGLSSFPSTFDQDFVDTTRVFVVGNGEAPIPDSHLVTAGGGVNPTFATDDPAQLLANGGAREWFVWRDATTSKTYAARSYARTQHAGATSTYRNDTAVRMLEMARRLQEEQTTACATPTSAACNAKTIAFGHYRQNLDVMRSLHNAFGYARYATDAPFFY